MAEDEAPVPDSLLPYDGWTQEALLHVVIRAIGYAAKEGLPGGHHFYVTFKTGYPGVSIPDRLRAQYPDEMTIVLQHQYSNLTMDEQTKVMFGWAVLLRHTFEARYPAAAITAFADPEVRFGLNFDVEMPASLPAHLKAMILPRSARKAEPKPGAWMRRPRSSAWMRSVRRPKE